MHAFASPAAFLLLCRRAAIPRNLFSIFMLYPLSMYCDIKYIPDSGLIDGLYLSFSTFLDNFKVQVHQRLYLRWSNADLFLNSLSHVSAARCRFFINLCNLVRSARLRRILRDGFGPQRGLDPIIASDKRGTGK